MSGVTRLKIWTFVVAVIRLMLLGKYYGKERLIKNVKIKSGANCNDGLMEQNIILKKKNASIKNVL